MKAMILIALVIVGFIFTQITTQNMKPIEGKVDVAKKIEEICSEIEFRMDYWLKTGQPPPTTQLKIGYNRPSTAVVDVQVLCGDRQTFRRLFEEISRKARAMADVH